MREIKFRAWNNKFKEFNFMSLINYLGDRGIIDNWADGENSVWEQYTGLKDKNGDDIYENDIVKTLGANIYVVEFFDGKFNPVSDLEGSNWEVIGNVHQNSDLSVNDTDRISPDDNGNDIHEFLHGGDK